MSEKQSAMDYPEHEKTYKMFIRITTWSSVAIATVLIVMAVTLL
jgi:hypothetical protein